MQVLFKNLTDLDAVLKVNLFSQLLIQSLSSVAENFLPSWVLRHIDQILQGLREILLIYLCRAFA